MTFQITGKNVDAGTAFQEYATDKISALLDKYIGQQTDGHIRLEKERGLFRSSCTIRLASGLTLEAHGDGGDAYSSVDSASHRLETRLRRYKERLKSHSAGTHTKRKGNHIDARDYTLSVPEDDKHPEDDVHPLIIAETPRNIGELTVSEAVMELDLSEAPFMIFKNAAHGGINLVYRRADGNIGWIDAAMQAAAANGSARG